MFCPVPSSHKRTVSSSLALTTYFPSGLKAALFTPAVCPCSSATRPPLATSQTRTVGSQRVGDGHAPPFTISLPSGLNVAAVIHGTCPSKTPTVFPELASQTRVVVSRL